MDEASRTIINRQLEELIRDMNADAVVINLQANLLLRDDEVNKILANSTREEKCQQFIAILKTKGPTAFHMFIQALQRTNQKHLADMLLEGKGLNHPSAAPPIFAELVLACFVGFFYLNHHHSLFSVQKSLRKMYLERFQTTSPFSSSFTYNIENTWVSLALKETAKHTKGTEDHAELLKQAFGKEKMLIVEGNPGTGKTSLMRRLAYEWARGKPELVHYDLIVYAEFRELGTQTFTQIAELVARYLQHYVGNENSTKAQKMLTNEKWFEDKHLVLVLLDGFDESSSEEQCEELYRYLTNDIIDKRPLFNIVMTARPGRLPAEHKGSIKGRFVLAEVLGFISEEQKIKYISNHFSNHEEEVKDESIYLLLKSKEIQRLATAKQQEMFILHSFNQTEADALKREAVSVYFMLKANKSLLEIAETPLFLTFICLVNNETLDDTNPLLDLYCKIIRWLLDRHQKTSKNVDVPNLFEYKTSAPDSSFVVKKRTIHNYYLHFPQLQNLGNMALHNLERNSFLQSDLERFNVRPIIEQVGLLRKEEKFDTYGHITTEFSFMHRTIQEFLAAFSYLHSYQMTSNDVNNFMERHIFHKTLAEYKTRPYFLRDFPKMTEYEKFLWRIATSNKLPISSEMRSHFFESYSTLVLHSDIFSSSAEICLQQSKIYLEKCSNVTELFLVFRDCSFQENSKLSCTNLPVLKDMHFDGCSFQETSQLNCTNLPVLKEMKFNWRSVPLARFRPQVFDPNETEHLLLSRISKG